MEAQLQPPKSTADRRTSFDDERSGYKKVLKPRQIQMMALGSAIGSGLFMGSGGRLASVGPSLFIAFAVCAEYWFALIKVATLSLSLVVGAVVLAAGWPLRTDSGTITPGIHLWEENGGIFPSGVLATVLVMQGVIFAFSGTELIGTAAGEAKDPEETMPKAIKSVIYRIVLFYIGSILLLTLLLPYTSYKAGQSPFVTFFASLGNGEFGLIAGSAMNFVVVTAALSSLNAGLYSTGRILRNMAVSRAASKFTARMNRAGVPYGGILLTVIFAVLGVALNLIVPSQAFEIMLNLAAIGVVSAWGTILLCQIQLRRWSKKGLVNRPAFRLPGAPVTAYLSLAFYLTVFALMCFDYPSGTWTVGTFVTLGVPLLIEGWFACRKRILAVASGAESPTARM